MSNTRALAFVVAAVAFSTPALAGSPPSMKIVEVYAGDAANPSSQFVEVQFVFAAVHTEAGTSITASNANDVVAGSAAVALEPVNKASQDRILFATAEAAAEFAIVPDVVMATAFIPAAGGVVCLNENIAGSEIDCVAY